MATTIKFFVEWHGEMAAGIRPGSENVSITFEHTDTVDSDTVEFWHDSLKEYYDGAAVYTEQEAKDQQRAYPCSECGQPYAHRNHWAPFGWHNYV